MKIVDIENQIIEKAAYSYVDKPERSNLLKISNSPTELKQKNGYVYAPLLSDDFPDQIIGLNFRRHINGKSLYPVFIEDKEKADKLINNKMTTLKNMLDTLNDGYNILINNDGTKNTLSSDFFCAIKDQITLISIHITTLQKIKTLCASNIKKLKENEKLYITGHGKKNYHELGATQDVNSQTISVMTLIDNLCKHNLSKRFNDIRINSCYSADIEIPESAHKDDLEKASNIVGEASFCEKMSELLFYKGFHSSVVTGYHGAGRTTGKFIHKTRLIANDDIRSSLVKKTFFANAQFVNKK